MAAVRAEMNEHSYSCGNRFLLGDEQHSGEIQSRFHSHRTVLSKDRIPTSTTLRANLSILKIQERTLTTSNRLRRS